jgi:hypothetical protein
VRRAARARPLGTAALGTAVAAALVTALAGCGKVIAPPPPAAAPQVQREGVVAGTPIVIAARAARVLQEYGFTTKRFSDDSLWGLRSADDIAARLRYVPRADSTRVLVELWGRCQDPRSCMRGDVAVILTRLGEAEAPPQ